MDKQHGVPKLGPSVCAVVVRRYVRPVHMFIDPTVDAQGFVQFPLEVPRLAERTQCQIIHVETPVSAGPGRSAHIFCTQAALPVPEEKPLAEVCAIRAPCWCRGLGVDDRLRIRTCCC